MPQAYFTNLHCKFISLLGGAYCRKVLRHTVFPYFFPKLTAQMAAVKGTASMTPMELATPETASRLI